ncbi:hypothetical protein [Desulfonema magnum]|uniref:DUF928 domain-containing protein n=1 Tax=Desulfonema magnum TaxID=45655 RepID=A0A975BMH6_9BACT|nr:hypothetical protein [Desulfonema magnum]QTA87977.1 Uncharacterized protein dnm_040170 [Desulfonema magnum]
MMRSFFLEIMVCLFLISMVPAAQAGKSSQSVGYIKIPAEMTSDECYTLWRDGKAVTKSPANIYVLNDDIIIPHKNKSVALIYRNTDCGEKMVNKRTIVKECKNQRSSGWLKSLFSEVVIRTKIERRNLAEENLMSTRAKDKAKDSSFFIGEFSTGDVWPVNGTTALYGKPILFRWKNGNISSDTEAKLVIVGAEKKSHKVIEADMKTGRFVRVSGKKLRPATSYKWYVKVNNKEVSDRYHFSILGKEQSDDIRSQLAEISKTYAGQSPKLNQALYLQLISDITPELDLYADSLRMVMEYAEIPVLDKVFEQISDYSRK